MSRPGLLLIGTGGHAIACIEAVESDGRFVVAGLVGEREMVGQQVLGHRVLGVDDDLPVLRHQIGYALIAVGQIRSSETRRRLFEIALSQEFTFPTIIAASASVSRYAKVGEGSVVMPHAAISASARIGRNVIINTAAIVEHGANVGHHCHISTGAILNGDVEIGEGSFIGSGSIIKQGVHIGRECIVGMGLAVRHDLADSTLFTGV